MLIAHITVNMLNVFTTRTLWRRGHLPDKQYTARKYNLLIQLINRNKNILLRHKILHN